MGKGQAPSPSVLKAVSASGPTFMKGCNLCKPTRATLKTPPPPGPHQLSLQRSRREVWLSCQTPAHLGPFVQLEPWAGQRRVGRRGRVRLCKSRRSVSFISLSFFAVY